MKKAFVCLLFLGLFCFCLEIALRVTVHYSGKVLFSELTTDDEILDWKLTPNYIQKIKDVQINSKGFRGTEFNKNKKNLFRIVAIGDSCVFGVGCSNGNSTFPVQLEKQLSFRNTNVHYEVINAGVPGYTTNQCLKFLNSELLDLDPDVIVVYCGWNDIWSYKNPYSNTAASPLLRSLSRFMSKSLLFTLFRDKLVTPARENIGYLLKNKKQSGTRPVHPLLKEQRMDFLKDNFSQMARVCKDHDIKMIILTLPVSIRVDSYGKAKNNFFPLLYWREGADGFFDMYLTVNSVIKSLDGVDGLKVVDIDDEFKNLPEQKINELFSDFVHPNDEGYALIAQDSNLIKEILK